MTGRSFGQFNIGISGEVSNSTYGGVAPSNATYESILGYGGSLITELRLTKNVWLSFQPGYVVSGSKVKFGNEHSIFNDTVITFNLKQNYFSLPLNVKIYNGRFFIAAGAAYNFLSSANVTNTANSDEKDITEKFKDYDIVSNFNVGYVLPLGKPFLSFELKYIQGLVNINNENNITAKDIYIENFKSKGFSFVTSLIYPIR